MDISMDIHIHGKLAFFCHPVCSASLRTSFSALRASNCVSIRSLHRPLYFLSLHPDVVTAVMPDRKLQKVVVTANKTFFTCVGANSCNLK